MPPIYIHRGEGGRERWREKGGNITMKQLRYILWCHTHTYSNREMAAQYHYDMWDVSRGKTEYANCVQGRAGESDGRRDKETSSANTTHGSGHIIWSYGPRGESEIG